MSFTVLTKTLWKNLDDRLNQAGLWHDFYAEHKAKIIEYVNAGKAPGVFGTIENVPDVPGEAYTKRLWADRTSAQEFDDFLVSLAQKYGVADAIISMEIVDLPAE